MTEAGTTAITSEKCLNPLDPTTLRFKPLTHENKSSNDKCFTKEKVELRREKQISIQSESITRDFDAKQRDIEFNKVQNHTDMYMPELVKMVPESVSNKDVQVGNLKSIKTENGQMQYLSCHCIYQDNEYHQRNCSKRADDGKRDKNTNTDGGIPDTSGYCTPVPSIQQRSFSGIKVELADLNSSYPEIKIEPKETNHVAYIMYTVHPSIQKEELVQCSSCKLYFSDKCAYLDHKTFTCPTDNFNPTTDISIIPNNATLESAETYSKLERTDDNQFQSDQTQIRTKMTNDYDFTSDGPSIEMEVPVNDCQPSFTCSCMNCDANFDDFFTYRAHKKSCKRPQIKTVIEQLNLRESACDICKKKFKSKLELSKHMVLFHVGSNTKKRKDLETDTNDDTEQIHATLARGITRNVKKFKCNFDDCIEKFQTLNDFKSHYAIHLQSVGTGAEQHQQEYVNQNETTVELEKIKTETCSPEGYFSFMKGLLNVQPHTDIEAARESHMSDPSNTNETYKVKKFQIEECVNSFDSAMDMNRHLQSVRGEIFKSLTKISKDKHVHQCQNKGCGLLFDTKELLKRHIRETHIVASSISRVDVPDLVQYVCKFCSRIFQYMGDVFKHIQEDHYVKASITSNLYEVENMNLCMICHLYIGSDLFLDHFNRCQKHSFIQSALNKSSQGSIKFDEIKTQATETIQVHEKDSEMGYTKLNPKATENSTEVSDNLDMTNFNPDYLRNYFVHHACVIANIGSCYKCKICNFTFLHKNELLAHLVKLHDVQYGFPSKMSFEGSSYRCKICSFAFSQQNGILIHLIKTHAVLNSLSAIETCSKVTQKSIKEIQKHVSILTKGPDIMFCCDFKDCRLLFRTKSTLEKHKLSEHFEQTSRFCNFKYHKDSDFSALHDKHALPTTNDQIKRKCALCDFNYTKTEIYKSHLLSHYDDVKLKCLNETTSFKGTMFQCQAGDCTAQFGSIADLVVHESKYHKAYNAHHGKHTLHTTKDQVQRKCALCDFNYTETEIYKSHLLSHYDDVKLKFLNETTSFKDTMFQCQASDCAAQFESIVDLVVHESKCHKAYYSAGSGKKVTIVVRKQQHIMDTVVEGNYCELDNLKNSENSSKEVLSKEENDSCTGSESTIKAEIPVAGKEMPPFNEKKHAINEKFDCHVCHKAFPNQQVLSLHIRSCHQIVSLKCGFDNCKAVFPTASGLMLHVKSHAKGTQSFKDNIKVCQFCSFKTCSEEIYTQHLSNYHKYNETSKRPGHKKTNLDKELDLDCSLLPYKCKVKGCSKAYLYHRDLVKHLQKKDHIFPCPEENCNSYFECPSTLKLHLHQDHVNVYTFNERQRKKVNIQDNSEHDKKLPYICPAKGCLEAYMNKRTLAKHFKEKHENLFSEEDLNSSGVSTNANKHTFKEPPTAESDDKDNESKLLCTISGFKIELVDDSDS